MYNMGRETTYKYQLGNLRSTWADNMKTDFRLDMLWGSVIGINNPKQYPAGGFGFGSVKYLCLVTITSV